MLRCSIVVAITVVSVANIARWTNAAVIVQWDSTDDSFAQVSVGEGGVFEWKHKTFGELKLTGGKGGSTFKISDNKRKGGKIDVQVEEVQKLVDPNYGKSGEPAIPLTGQTLSGFGFFTVSFTNFVEINDDIVNLTADLISDGTNPINLNVFGQGDQLAAPKSGDVSYVTKWESTDAVILSNGAVFGLGSFILTSVGDPSAFEYTLTPPSFSSSFTIGNQYQFVRELSLPPTGSNLLQAVNGSVTKHLNGTIVPEPSTFTGFAISTLGLLRWGLRRRIGGKWTGRGG